MGDGKRRGSKLVAETAFLSVKLDCPLVFTFFGHLLVILFNAKAELAKSPSFQYDLVNIFRFGSS